MDRLRLLNGGLRHRQNVRHPQVLFLILLQDSNHIGHRHRVVTLSLAPLQGPCQYVDNELFHVALQQLDRAVICAVGAAIRFQQLAEVLAEDGRRSPAVLLLLGLAPDVTLLLLLENRDAGDIVVLHFH